MYKIVFNKDTNEIVSRINIGNNNPDIFKINDSEGFLLISELPKDIENYLANEEGLYEKPTQPQIVEPTTEEMLLQAYMKINELEDRLNELEGK